MCLSSIAAISFWFLALLVTAGLYKLYNSVMAAVIGRSQDDIFECVELLNDYQLFLYTFKFSSIFSSDIHVSDRQAYALANYIRVNGTSILRQTRNLFLWDNLTNSFLVNNLNISFI